MIRNENEYIAALERLKELEQGEELLQLRRDISSYERSNLGADLRCLREQYIAEGGKLFTVDERAEEE